MNKIKRERERREERRERRGEERRGFDNARRSISTSGFGDLSTRQLRVSAAGIPSNVVCGDALFAEVHVHGCCSSVGVHTESLGGCDWT